MDVVVLYYRSTVGRANIVFPNETFRHTPPTRIAYVLSVIRSFAIAGCENA